MKSDVSMPDFKSSYQKMEKIASSLNAELANFHVGRANTEMLVLKILKSNFCLYMCSKSMYDPIKRPFYM